MSYSRERRKAKKRARRRLRKWLRARRRREALQRLAQEMGSFIMDSLNKESFSRRLFGLR